MTPLKWKCNADILTFFFLQVANKHEVVSFYDSAVKHTSVSFVFPHQLFCGCKWDPNLKKKKKVQNLKLWLKQFMVFVDKTEGEKGYPDYKELNQI